MKKINKPIRDPRCIHMPTEDNTVVIFSLKRGNVYESGFTIGNQHFTVSERDTKEEAQWFCDVLENAFQTLITPKGIESVKNEENKQLYIEKMPPKITIKNLR